MRIQNLSESEKVAINRAQGMIETNLRCTVIKHDYIARIAKAIDGFPKQVAKAKYE